MQRTYCEASSLTITFLLAAGAGTRAWRLMWAAGATSTPASPTSTPRSSAELENTTYTDLLVAGRGAAAVQAVQLQHEPQVPGGEEGDGPQHQAEGAPLRRAQQVSQLPLVLASSVYFIWIYLGGHRVENVKWTTHKIHGQLKKKKIHLKPKVRW